MAAFLGLSISQTVKPRKLAFLKNHQHQQFCYNNITWMRILFIHSCLLRQRTTLPQREVQQTLTQSSHSTHPRIQEESAAQYQPMPILIPNVRQAWKYFLEVSEEVTKAAWKQKQRAGIKCFSQMNLYSEDKHPSGILYFLYLSRSDCLIHVKKNHTIRK